MSLFHAMVSISAIMFDYSISFMVIATTDLKSSTNENPTISKNKPYIFVISF